MTIRKPRPNRMQRPITLTMTRADFASMANFEYDLPCYVRYRSDVVWIVDAYDGEDTDLPTMNKSQFASTQRDSLPAEFVITYSKKPLFIVREI